uniref:BLOC-1-related complex subunit 7 n=1 Tax=Crocodylus porosus TaxID=8502 RepID=A0A7M4F4U8_CROPO
MRWPLSSRKRPEGGGDGVVRARSPARSPPRSRRLQWGPSSPSQGRTPPEAAPAAALLPACLRRSPGLNSSGLSHSSRSWWMAQTLTMTWKVTGCGTDVIALTKQVLKGSRSAELLGQAARNMVLQEDAILHSEDVSRRFLLNVEQSSNLQDQLRHLLK